MNRIRGNGRHILTWLIGSALTLAPVALTSTALAAQAQDQSNQQANSGQAAPSPDAQNAQPPADAQSGQQTDNQETAAPPPPPPSDAQSGQPADNGQTTSPPANSQDQPGQQGQWGPAGPPPDAQNGQIPPQSQDQDQGEPPDQGQGYGAPPAQGQDYGQGGYGASSTYPNQSRPILPTAPVTIPAGTPLQVRNSSPLDTKKLRAGDYFQGTLARGVFLGNMLVVPRGAQVVGRVVEVKKAGTFKGGARLTLQVTRLNMSGQSYPMATNVWSSESPGKGGYTAGNAVGGAVLGSIIGAIAGGGPGAAIGAAAGTGVGLGASAASPGPRNVVPPESVLGFHLIRPVTVGPITYQEVQEIEQSAPPPPQRRPRYGAYPPPPPPYYGGYPPPPPPPPPPGYYARPYPY